MEPLLPKLRSDLLISRQETSGEAHVVVKDPLTQRFFRLRGVEYAVARRLDGSTPFDSVARDVQTEFDVALDTATVTQFAEQLRRCGLLHTESLPSSERRPLRSRVAGNLLYIRLKAIDPDWFFNRLIGRVGFFFTPWFAAISLASVSAALAITLSGWEDIVRDVGRLYRFDALLLAWLTVLLVTATHECAHGLTCKRFGGEVHEIGFLLLYFQPAFYCNISDAWLFPEKSKRLWVTFAGAYFEIFVWSLATLTWWVTETDTWVSFLALIVMATSGIKTLFNLNPLIKLDGYYLLSDYLEIPNLRQRSFAYLRALLRRVTGLSPGETHATPRERRVYVTYGVLAAVYSFWLLGLVALRFGNFLVERYQGPGFLAFSGLMALAFRNPLRRVTYSLPSGLRCAPILLTKRRAARAALLILAPSALVFGQLELKVSGDFTVLPVRNADVRATVDGLIETIYADEGDTVQAGDVLARLSGRDYQTEIGKIEADRAVKRATLAMLRAGPRTEELDLVRDEVQTVSTRLEYARSDLRRSKQLFERGLFSPKQLEDSEREAAVQQNALEEANAKLKLLQAGSRPETIEATEAEIRRLETHRRYLVEQLNHTTIVSPASGIVTTPKLKERVGEYVRRGDLIAKVYELEHVIPEVVISEKEIADVQPGQAVVMKARAYPGERFVGVVKAIAPAAIEDTQLGRRVFRVRVELAEAHGLLKPEMTGSAKILCGNRPVLSLLTRRMARYLRVEFWSWW